MLSTAIATVKEGWCVRFVRSSFQPTPSWVSKQRLVDEPDGPLVPTEIWNSDI